MLEFKDGKLVASRVEVADNGDINELLKSLYTNLIVGVATRIETGDNQLAVQAVEDVKAICEKYEDVAKHIGIMYTNGDGWLYMEPQTTGDEKVDAENKQKLKAEIYKWYVDLVEKNNIINLDESAASATNTEGEQQADEAKKSYANQEIKFNTTDAVGAAVSIGGVALTAAMSGLSKAVQSFKETSANVKQEVEVIAKETSEAVKETAPEEVGFVQRAWENPFVKWGVIIAGVGAAGYAANKVFGGSEPDVVIVDTTSFGAPFQIN
jgi:hypothetical protein